MVNKMTSKTGRWGVLARCLTVITVLTLALGANHSARAASGYGFGYLDAASAGSAFAGGAAAGTSASTVFFNPAAMSRFDHNEFAAGGTFLYSDIDYGDIASNLAGGPLSGGEGGNGGKLFFIPNLYAVYDLKPDVKLGIGLNAPYGLVTQYEETWKGRYNETLTSLKHLVLNPSLSWRINSQWSVGGGVNLTYAKARLRQAIDFGSICTNALGAGACAGFGLVAGQSDGTGQVDGDEYGFGYNFGILYEPWPGTRIGAHYRSKVDYDFRSVTKFTVGAGARAFLNAANMPNAFTDTKSDFDLTIPETASLSVYHDVSDKLAFMADLTWTHWRRFDELRIEADEPTTPTNLILTFWDDTLRISVGGAYKWNDKLTLRGGVAFEEGAINTPFRGPGVPDNDRFEAAVGLGYQITDSVSLEGAYTHLFFRDGATVRAGPTGSKLIGEFRNSVDVLSLGLTWKF